MAATHYNPASAAIEDPVTYKEASALLARTGHPAAYWTIARWGLPKVCVGGTNYVSWSDVLEAHGDRVAAKLRASGDWP